MKDRKFLLLFITIFLDLFGFGIVIPVLPSYIKNLAGGDGKDWVVGIIIACFSVAQFFSTPLLGGLSDRLGRRPILLWTLLGNCIGYFTLAIANTLPLLMLSRTISGFCSGNLSVAQAYITDISTKENRTKAMGMIGAAFGMGFILGPPIGGYLNSHFGFWSLGAFSGGLCALNAIIMYFLLPESITIFNKDKKINLLPFKEFVKVFETPFFGRIFIISFIFVTGFFLFQIPSPLLWKEHFHLDEEHIGYLFGIVGISTSVVQAGLVGPIKKLLGEKNMLIFGNIIQGVTICAVPFIPIEAFWVLMPTCLFFQSLGNGMLNPALMSYLSQNTEPQHQGRMFGLYQSFGSLARIVGPVLGATLYGLHYIVPYATALVLFVLNTLLSLGIGSILSKYLLKKNQLDSEEIIQTENVYS
jgi:multidrug resistance protein